MTRKLAVQNILLQCNKQAIPGLNSNGYFNAPIENLLTLFPNWPQIELEIGKGNGSEFVKDQFGRAKFCAAYSSSALCINNFAPVHNSPAHFSFLGYSGFYKAQFEKVLPIGVPNSFPNLDFYLESEHVAIGFESKFLETIEPKKPDLDNSLSKYVTAQQLQYLQYISPGYLGVLQQYIGIKAKLHVDVAQLLKHGMAIIKNGIALQKKPVLVYLYWLPDNWQTIKFYHSHLEELEEFKILISPFIEFYAMSYLEFWNTYQNDPILGNHIKSVTTRYMHDLI